MNTGELLGSNSYIAFANTLGHAVVIETLKMAAYYLSHSNGLGYKSYNVRTTMSEAKSCYLFVQGTGLEVTMERFGLNYDTGKIKNMFNYLIRKSI